jgi:hypothetical protein
MLVRGVDTYGHFEPEQRPTADFAPEAVAYHAAVQERLNAITRVPSSPPQAQSRSPSGG